MKKGERQFLQWSKPTGFLAQKQLMDAKKIASTLKALQKKKASLEEKRAETIKQLDEEIAATAKEIQGYSKVLEKLDQLTKAVEEQMAIADGMKKDKKAGKDAAKEPKKEKAVAGDKADSDDIFSE